MSIRPSQPSSAVSSAIESRNADRSGNDKSISASNEQIICFVDFIEKGCIEGWAFDSNHPERLLTVEATIDGRIEARAECTIERPDVLKAGFPKLLCGFRLTLPRRLLDGLDHTLQITIDESLPILFMRDGKRTDESIFAEKVVPILRGSVDGVEHGILKGWVVLEDPATGNLTGDCQLLITCDGVACGNTRANWGRPDVASALKCDAACGFQFSPPEVFRSTYAREYRLFVMPERIEIPQSPCVTSLVDDRLEGTIRALAADLARLYSEIGRLRGELTRLIPAVGYNLSRYHSWAENYLPALSQRVAALPTRGRRAKKPLVSVLMPVYRPNLEEFQQAVHSVMRQTYQNWQLILVDDGSEDDKISSLISDLVHEESRIISLQNKTNLGISASTNIALGHARGEWIAFFDHDDLLVDVALEIMIDAAQRHGARLLYSDEDKIDQAGHYLDPSFKPDWNYRLLLGVNYICHFVLVRSDVARKVGPFNSDVDGAQDHDFLLRVAEVLEPQFIHHVPEILYHWRMSLQSTAASTAAKPYAVLAGQAAVAGHLERQRKAAEVVPIHEKTFYRIDWKPGLEPKVAIVIPFKDQSRLTRRCVEALVSITQYAEFEIILVDNWSTEEETVELLNSYSYDQRISVYRVEEEFNYSRLNNYAMTKTDAKFVVFLNNDVFIHQANWLGTLVREALADPTVAAVGGKLLYPDGTVQHGGVVCGIGGVAGHSHTTAKFDSPGYGGRLWFAQEITAVTAACMLVRTSVFREVGGFDETELKVAFNDVDLCLKIRAAGHKIVWTPELVAEHHESVSRGFDTHNEKEMRFFKEVDIMKRRWGDVLINDPFYNKNFSLDGRPFFDLVDPAFVWEEVKNAPVATSVAQS